MIFIEKHRLKSNCDIIVLISSKNSIKISSELQMNDEKVEGFVEKRLLELAELLPHTFWRHLDRMNVKFREKA